jgi:RNA polymerase sigma-70 factor (ECF subfamily)
MDAPVSAQRKADEHADLDEVTLARAQRGDRDARAALIARYQRPVFALLSRMLSRQRALVEDMAQETFLRVLRALPTFDARGPARLGTWILTIATRLVLDHFRRRPEQVLDLQAAGAIPTALPRPDQDADRRALAIELLRAVDELGAPFRAAFLLREAHGLSYDEIAAVLEVDIGTVKSRLARARRALQGALAEMHEG